jgi:UDP-N-acetylmuramoylalanine--D-glutamate ligase
LRQGQEILGDVCVLGLGKTGVEVARYLCGLRSGRVSSVTLFAGAAAQESDVTRELSDLGVNVVLGTEEVSGSFDLAIASPGISEFSPFFLSACSCSREIVGEPEFAWRESPERWLAITGSNGKTTTTSLATALLREGGLPAAAVGNIGNLCTTEVATREPDEWFVAELSSFQLAGAHQLHPRDRAGDLRAVRFDRGSVAARAEDERRRGGTGRRERCPPGAGAIGHVH